MATKYGNASESRDVLYIGNGKRDLEEYVRVSVDIDKGWLSVFGIPYVHGKEDASSLSGYIYCNMTVHRRKVPLDGDTASQAMRSDAFFSENTAA